MKKLVFYAQRRKNYEHVWWNKQWCDISLVEYAVHRTRHIHTVPDTSGERRWPNTDRTSVLTKACDLDYINSLQAAFDETKDKLFNGFTALAAGSERAGMRFGGLEMRRGAIDMLVLQQMARRP